MNIDVWKTMYDKDFDPVKYLYHYTNIEKAIKILHSESLRFSSISRTNDTSESKLKISYEGDSPHLYEKIETVYNYFKDNIGRIRLLCFSMDIPIADADRSSVDKFLQVDPRYEFQDITGRGFASPRMWAQYAKNNEGVCFVVNKGKLNQQIKRKTAFYRESKVNYRRFFECYKIKEQKLNEIYDKIYVSGTTMFIKMLENDEFFLEHNFFTKSKDWENECEYRYVTAIDDMNIDVHAENLFGYLEGIVVGENIDPAHKKVIELLLGGRTQVMSIVFGNTISMLR